MPMTQYRDALSRKPELGHETIDLQFANARQGRDTDRRFSESHPYCSQPALVLPRYSVAFEIVTPHFGKRMYQTTSYEDMKVSSLTYCLLSPHADLLLSSSPGFTPYVMR